MPRTRLWVTDLGSRNVKELEGASITQVTYKTYRHEKE